MSERSFRGYRAATPLLRPALSAVRWWGVQTAIYAERVNRLIGPGAGVVAVTGSMKYEGACCDRNHPQTAELRRLFGLTPDDIVWVAGSTQPGEDEVVLEAMQVLRKEFPALRLILVPRHPERFDAAAGLIEQKELEFVRRSDLGDGFRQGAAVALVDSVGELGAVWGLADFAFVGGSLSGRRGGQSMIEPAAYGVATCFGPETWNFQDTVDRLREVDGAVQLRQASELLPTLCGWLHDRDAARRIGENARQFIASQQGAVAATLEGVYRCLSEENATRTRLSA
jgi:3-deoxy-D-manno-octulosonic-acid transferase